MTSEPVPPPADGTASPLGPDPLYAIGDANAETRLATPRPQTGDEGAPWRWWQVLAGILGWLLALALMWYFGHAADALAWSLLVAILVVALLVGFGSALVSVNALRPRLVARRAHDLPVAHPKPLDHDALGRPVATTEGALRTAAGELVAVITPAGRMFLPPDEAEPYLAATLAARRG